MFKLNDNVIYPGHGVAVVEEIIEKTVSGAPIQFFKLTFLFKDMTILAPLYNSTVIGIRCPSSVAEIDQAVGELAKKPDKKLESIDFTPSGWNRRHKDYQLKIQNGRLLDVAQIYRDLMYISQQKDLSFGERAVLQIVEELFVQEVQIVLSHEREVVVQMLRSSFKQFRFHDRMFSQQEASIL